MACPTCHGEGYIGTGYSDSFVDASDAMPCPNPECDAGGDDAYDIDDGLDG